MTSKKAGPAGSGDDRILFPATGFTKREALDYYRGIAPVLLPHIRNRPMSLKRFPGAVTEDAFWEKDAPGFTPDWVNTVAVPRRSGKSDIEYIVVGNERTLEWIVGAGGIELHPFLHTVRDLRRPTAVVFDLDPGAGVSLVECAGVAIALRAYLEDLELEAFAKVSGSKGAQVYVPLNTEATHEQTELFARLVAEEMARLHPDLVVAKIAKRLRVRKVFIDYSQNAGYKTTVAPYSLRGNRETPLVSLPVEWRELEAAVRKGDAARLEFDPRLALRRAESKGDLFAPVLKKKQRLPERFTAALRKLKKTPRPDREEEGEGKLVRGIRLPRFGTQGGRRLFVLPKTETGNELWLDVAGTFRRFILRPDREESDMVVAMPAGKFAANPSWFRGEVQEEYRDTVTIEDIGAYELIEGSWREQRLDLWFTGRTMEGRWVLEKTTGPKHKSWRLRPAKRVKSV